MRNEVVTPRNDFVTPFWQRAYDSLPAQVRGQYLTQMKAAEGWELALNEIIQVLSRAKNAIVKLFQAPSRAH
jgi:hypothetical protein